MKNFNIPESIKKIRSFMVMDILELAKEMEKEGKDIIHLEVGEPDFPTPEIVKNEGMRSLENGDTYYTHSLGLIELREAIVKYYKKKYNVKITSDQIIITSGTSPAMMLTFAILIERGSEFLISNPYYACYPNFVHLFHGKVKYFPLDKKHNFAYPIDEIKKMINKNTKGLMINSPANPTGVVLTKENLKNIAKLPIWKVSDEIYHGLVYGEKDHSMLEFTNEAFVVNGFSKLFAMTGWRLGYVIAPLKFIRPIQNIGQSVFISANPFVQRAGIAALLNAEKDVEKMRKEYDLRRKYLLKTLPAIGLKIACVPKGAFYILVDVKKYTNNSLEFAREILISTGVALTPGIDFGSEAEGYLRFAYANSMENIKEAVTRLSKFFCSL